MDHAISVTTPLVTPITLELLNKMQLTQRLNLSMRTLDSMVKAGEFPQGVRMGRLLYWTDEAVQAWYKRQFAAQRAWQN